MKFALTRSRKAIPTGSVQSRDELASIWTLRLVIHGKFDISGTHTCGDDFLNLVGPFLKWTKLLSTKIIQIADDPKMQRAASEMTDIRDVSGLLGKTRMEWSELTRPFAKLFDEQHKAVRNMLLMTLKSLENTQDKDHGTIETNVDLLAACRT